MARAHKEEDAAGGETDDYQRGDGNGTSVAAKAGKGAENPERGEWNSDDKEKECAHNVERGGGVGCAAARDARVVNGLFKLYWQAVL